MVKKPLDDESRSEITKPAKPESVAALIDFVASYAQEMMFDDKRIAQVRLALEETLGNIIRFACPAGNETITMSCDAHEMGALLLDIVDSGEPYNMLVISTFPEVAAHSDDPTCIPSTKAIKRYIKNIEYRRDGENRTNILACVISK